MSEKDMPLAPETSMHASRSNQADLVGGALATLACYGFFLYTGTQPPVGVEGALATVCGYLLAICVKDRYI